MFVLWASESKWAGLIAPGKVFLSDFFDYEGQKEKKKKQIKESCKTLTKFKKEKWESMGFAVLFYSSGKRLLWSAAFLRLTEQLRFSGQHAWQLPGIYHRQINCKQDKLHPAAGLQEAENRRFLYHQCGEMQTSEEVKEMETIWPTSLCRWYCRRKMINHKIGFGPCEKMLNNKTHDHGHSSFI